MAFSANIGPSGFPASNPTLNTVYVKAAPKLARNFLDCTLDNWVFYKFLLADESFLKALQSLKTCLSIDNNLCENLASSL